MAQVRLLIIFLLTLKSVSCIHTFLLLHLKLYSQGFTFLLIIANKLFQSPLLIPSRRANLIWQLGPTHIYGMLYIDDMTIYLSSFCLI